MQLKILFYTLVWAILAFTTGTVEVRSQYADTTPTRVDSLISILKNPEQRYVMVAVHRGDWRHFPENSLQAIQSTIDMGADIVEIDLQLTKDNELVLMHDKTIDRTTTGRGNVSDYTLEELRKFRLKSGMGKPTDQRIPTLEEAMLVAKDKILVNLDHGYDFFKLAYAVLRKTETVDHAIFKGKHSLMSVRKDLGSAFDEVFFMPIVDIDKPDAERIIDEYLSQKSKPVAFELLFVSERSHILHNLNRIQAHGSRVWVNTLWDELCAGHTDDKAVTDISAVYGWAVEKGFNMIQTDRPQLLIKFLKENKLH